MPNRLIFLLVLVLLNLVGCASNEVKEKSATDGSLLENPDTIALAKPAEPSSGPNPPMTITKGKKTLNLVRIMDGGICKNEYEGAKGAFLLYADTQDIERIKKAKGAAIFKTFETKIQEISGDILQAAIDRTNLGEDPFALGADEAQQKLASKLVMNFRDAATDIVAKFQKETSLTIDISAFQPSLVFFQKGCDESKLDAEGTESAS